MSYQQTIACMRKVTGDILLGKPQSMIRRQRVLIEGDCHNQLQAADSADFAEGLLKCVAIQVLQNLHTSNNVKFLFPERHIVNAGGMDFVGISEPCIFRMLLDINSTNPFEFAGHCENIHELSGGNAYVQHGTEMLDTGVNV